MVSSRLLIGDVEFKDTNNYYFGKKDKHALSYVGALTVALKSVHTIMLKGLRDDNYRTSEVKQIIQISGCRERCNIS